MRYKIRFSIKCILVMLPLIAIIFYSAYNLIAFCDGEIPYYIWNKDVCYGRNGETYEVLILGDSTANASYVPELLSDKTINLSLGGCTPMEMYYVLQDYLTHHKAPDSIYISFMDTNLNNPECFWTRTMYSHRFSLLQNLEMYREAVSFQEPSVVEGRGWKDFMAYQFYLPKVYITALENAHLNQRREENEILYEEAGLHGGRYIARGNQIWETWEVKYEHFWVSPLYDMYYNRLLSLCIDNGIMVHLVKTPLEESEQFSKQYIREIDDYYQQLIGDNSNITWDWFDGYDATCFYDDDHVNTKGAIRFTEDLKQLYSEEFTETYTERQRKAIDEDVKEVQSEIEQK